MSFAQPQPNMETLAEAFSIANGHSPLVPDKSHLHALVLHARQWNTTIMEASTPSKTLRCQHPDCKGGYVDWTDGYGRTKQVECPVCEGDPEITFETVASYASQIDQLREDNRQLRESLSTAERREVMWKGLHDAVSMRLGKTDAIKPKPPVRIVTGNAVEEVS